MSRPRSRSNEQTAEVSLAIIDSQKGGKNIDARCSFGDTTKSL